MIEHPSFMRENGSGARLPVGFWVGFAMVLGAGGVAGTSLAIVLLTGIVRLPDKRLHMACDHVVETLLTTHDPVELERARILVKVLDCDVENRIAGWSPGRTGGLVH